MAALYETLWARMRTDAKAQNAAARALARDRTTFNTYG